MGDSDVGSGDCVGRMALQFDNPPPYPFENTLILFRKKSEDRGWLGIYGNMRTLIQTDDEPTYSLFKYKVLHVPTCFKFHFKFNSSLTSYL